MRITGRTSADKAAIDGKVAVLYILITYQPGFGTSTIHLDRSLLWRFITLDPHVIIAVGRHDEPQIILPEKIEEIRRFVRRPIWVHKLRIVLKLAKLYHGGTMQVELGKVIDCCQRFGNL